MLHDTEGNRVVRIALALENVLFRLLTHNAESSIRDPLTSSPSPSLSPRLVELLVEFRHSTLLLAFLQPHRKPHQAPASSPNSTRDGFEPETVPF